MEGFEPIILAFACHYCAYAAADVAGTLRLAYPGNVKIVKVPCTGKVDVLHLLHALQKGADGVLVAGCLEGDCHFVRGNLLAKKRVAYAQKILADIGIEPERLKMVFMSAGQGEAFARQASEFTAEIRALGPCPVKAGARKAAA